MVTSAKLNLKLPLLEAVALIFSAISVSLPMHREHELALDNPASTEAHVHPSELKTYLRGQANTGPSLFQTNSSTVDQEDGVSSDLGDLQDIEHSLPAGDAKDSKVLEDEVSDLFKMANLRTNMTKEQFEATPMGSSVKKISHLIEKVMMPKVTEAHKANQGELVKLSKDLSKCGSTKNEQVTKADLKKAMYLKFSPLHATCRAGEAGQFSEKESCWEEEADKKKIKDLKCKTFAMISKQLGDQQASKQIMQKGGSESTESYVNRMSATVCGQCVGKGCSLKKSAQSPAKCGYEPYTCGCGFKCKFDKAKDDCQKATEEWQAHNRKCKSQTAQYLAKQTQCNSLQDQMDDASCKRAVEMKDACESYAECYFDKKRAYHSLEKMVKKEEKDRKAEWRGLKRMKCLVEAFGGGKVTNSEVNACKQKTHSTDHLTIKYPKLDTLAKCEVPHHYPNTPAYKADNFAPLPALAKGKQDAYQCTGVQEIETTPATGSPKSCKCTRVTLNGPYSPGPMVKCTNCLDVRRSQEKNSCPDGTKLFSPRNAQDWKTFLTSASPLRAPNFIIDITRPQNGCGGCKSPMNSGNPKQKSWSTADNSAWWLSSKKDSEPNGNYYANCYLNLKHFKQSGSEPEVVYDDANCNYHSKSYFCQAADVDLSPKPGSPDGCVCSLVSLTGKYSAGSLIKCTGCIRVSRSLEKNSCPTGTKIFSPRSREDWKTFIASAAPLRSPDWIIDITQAQKGCGGCTKSAMNSHSPSQATWRTSDNTPWFLRSSKYSEPNGDYAANCYLRLNTAVSEDSVTFNDHNCNYNSNAYYCQPAKVKKPVAVDPPSPPPPPPAPPAKPPVPKAGGKYTGFKCAGGSYTGAHSKCGHFTDLSESECWEKCEKSASAQDKDSCDEKTGVPECVASVYDKAKKTCILHRQCTKLTTWKGHPKVLTRIKSTYNPAATKWDVFASRVCKGDPYTRPDDKKKGLKGVTEAQCKAACFNNQWTGSKSVPMKRCAAFTFYSKAGYCDFFATCQKTKKKSGATTYVKLLADQTAKTKASKKSKKKNDEDDEDEEGEEDEEDEEEDEE